MYLGKKKKSFIHENPFSCAICMKGFSRKVTLRSHLKRTSHSVAKQWPSSLKAFLPQDWSYNIISFHKNGSHYRIKFVLPDVVSLSDLRSWIDSFIRLSRCVYIRVGRKENRSDLTPYTEFYRCQHFHPRKDGKKRSKGTGCKSSINASIKCNFSADPYYGIVSINFFHNHPIHSGETLKFRKPSVEVEKIFRRMLEDNFNPALALRNFMIHLDIQPADLYKDSINDRTKCPDYNWVHHFCSKLFKTAKRDINQQHVQIFKMIVEGINEEFGSHLCSFQELKNNNYAISILTPLMRRGLECQVAGEIMFVDSINCTDKFGLNIFILSCIFNSTTRIPLGVIITSAESVPIFEHGLKLYLLMTDNGSFGGRGGDGPAVIMTDYSKVKVRALKCVFPKAVQLWRSFYFLRSAYCWLLNSKYHVDKNDLGQLYSAIRKLVYSSDENILEDNYLGILQINSHNPHLISYLKNLYEKRHKWALCFSNLFPRQNNECNKVLECEAQILKEEIVNLVKIQSPNALIRYFVSEYDEYYMKKLIDNCLELDQNYFNKFLSDTDAENYTFGHFLESESLYYVFNKNKKTKYIVNMDIGMCTCFIGVSGNFCRHQRILKNAFFEEPVVQYPIIVEPKVQLYYIATGSNEVSQTVFDSFQTVETIGNDIQYAMEVVLQSSGISDSSGGNAFEENLDMHVVEEIVIEVRDEDAVDNEESSDETTDSLAITEDQVFNSENEKYTTNDLRECFYSLIAKLKENMEYYEPGIRAIHEELKKLNEGSASDHLLALHSFNKCS